MSGKNQDYYVVYWYPTIFHREKQRLDDAELEFIDISDSSCLPLSLKKAEEKKHLIYTLRFEDTKKEITFKLTYVNERNNGFTVYKYDRKAFRENLEKNLIEQSNTWKTNPVQENTSPAEEECPDTKSDQHNDRLDELIDQIFISCYHSAKDLYHKHEIQDSSDGRLKAYLQKPGTKAYLTSEPDISTPNHEAISFFIEEYEKLFNGYVQAISGQYSRLKGYLFTYFQIMRGDTPNTKEDFIAYFKKIDMLARGFDNLPDSSDSKGTPATQAGDDDIQYEDFRESIRKSVEQEEKEELQRQKARQEETEEGNYEGKSLEEVKELIWKAEKKVHVYLFDFLRSLQVMCGNALTEYNYCKSLLESKYNTEYKYNLQLTDEELSKLGAKRRIAKKLKVKDDRRKCAFNIRNCIRYIVEVRSKCDAWENSLTRDIVQKVNEMQQTAEELNRESEKIGKRSEKLGEISLELSQRSNELGEISVKLGRRSLWLGIWSFILTVISIALAVISVWLGIKSDNPDYNNSETTPPSTIIATDSSTTTPVVTDSSVISNIKPAGQE